MSTEKEHKISGSGVPAQRRGIKKVPASLKQVNTVVSETFWPVWIKIKTKPQNVKYYTKKFSKTFLKAIKNVPSDSQALVAYYKEFIRGIPEYDLLIKSGQIKIVKNILNALARQSEVLKNHQERIKALEEAVNELGARRDLKTQIPKKEIPTKPTTFLGAPLAGKTATDMPLYAAFFTVGAFQDWLDRTAGVYLHDLVGKGAESQIIDSAFGIGHRLKAGHDLTGFIAITKAEGIEGAATWFQHMFADLTSPHGIPLPGASYLYRFLKETVGVSEKFFIDWGCVSATDIVTGGLALLILARMHHVAGEKQRIFRLATLTVGQVALLALVEANPFFLATIPIQVLLARHEWRKMQLRKVGERLQESRQRIEEVRNILDDSKQSKKSLVFKDIQFS